MPKNTTGNEFKIHIHGIYSNGKPLGNDKYETQVVFHGEGPKGISCSKLPMDKEWLPIEDGYGCIKVPEHDHTFYVRLKNPDGKNSVMTKKKIVGIHRDMHVFFIVDRDEEKKPHPSFHSMPIRRARVIVKVHSSITNDIPSNWKAEIAIHELGKIERKRLGPNWMADFDIFETTDTCYISIIPQKKDNGTKQMQTEKNGLKGEMEFAFNVDKDS